jgi:hypothetical protein
MSNHSTHSFGTPLLSHTSAARGTATHRIPVTRPHEPRGSEAFQPLPPPPGKPPFRLDLADLVGKARIKAIKNAGKMVFHSVGDTGGIKDAVPQTIVAKKMVEQLKTPLAGRPAFFYHLGDVVYFKGEAAQFFPQFYEAYEHYSAPILAIPGNHDGTPPGDGSGPLDAFMRNFCNAQPALTPEAVDVQRTAMTQPNCYFTLLTPFATFVGLYSNVPSGGRIHRDQLDWLVGELHAADPDKALILSVHHPIYSADDHHSGNEKLEALIHGAYQTARRIPDAVLTGHVHNFQRFTRKFGKKSVPYLVLGAGGYHNLHGMVKAPDHGELPVPFEISTQPPLQLEDYVHSRHGFARITASAKELLFEYFTVPRPHESWSKPAERYDTCRLNWRTGHILAA